MGGTKSLLKPVLKIKLLVDKKKNKVVFAEVGKDFVDVLFSFLVLPMGTIVRLLEKYQQNQKSQAPKIGCFNNLYKNVRNMDTDDFLTEACKHALLHTRSVKDRQCRQLKINIDDNEVLKYYSCPKKHKLSIEYSHAYSNFCSSRCICGSLINLEVDGNVGNIDKKLFESESEFFIVTDNMEVECASVSFTFKTIKGLGYTDADKLEEIIIDVNHEKVLALLECLFSSDTPLTDVFLSKTGSYVVTRSQNIQNMPNLAYVDKDDVLSITLFISKQKRKFLYAESSGDFVDLLFSFLALSMESVWKLCGTNFVLGCIGTFCKSFKRLNAEKNLDTYRSMLHWHYRVRKPLLDVSYTDECGSTTLLKEFTNYSLYPIGSVSKIKGFVKKGQMYMISDDLTITPVNSSSSFCMLKKLEADLDDIEGHVIKISRAEALRLLITSLMTSTALTTALSCLIPKK